MTTKFLQAISNSSATLKNRANAIATQAEMAQSTILTQLQTKKAKIELEIAELLDFSPESTHSLRPGRSDWDAQSWANQLNAKQVELYGLEITIKLAQETYNKLFTEIENEQ